MQSVRVNLKNNAASQYTNFDFNSMINFNGVMLGAGASGIRKLCCSDDDAGTDINGYFTPHLSNLGSPSPKRIRYLYVTGEMATPITATLVTDQKKTCAAKVIKPQSNTGEHRPYTSMERTTPFTCATIKIANVEGGYFAIDMLEVDIQEMNKRRKHGNIY